MSEVVRELYIAREGERERLVEVEHFEQLVPLDHVQVAVGKCSHVGRRLNDGRLLPELIAEYVAFTFSSQRRSVKSLTITTTTSRTT